MMLGGAVIILWILGGLIAALGLPSIGSVVFLLGFALNLTQMVVAVTLAFRQKPDDWAHLGWALISLTITVVPTIYFARITD